MAEKNQEQHIKSQLHGIACLYCGGGFWYDTFNTFSAVFPNQTGYAETMCQSCVLVHNCLGLMLSEQDFRDLKSELASTRPNRSKTGKIMDSFRGTDRVPCYYCNRMKPVGGVDDGYTGYRRLWSSPASTGYAHTMCYTCFTQILRLQATSSAGTQLGEDAFLDARRAAGSQLNQKDDKTAKKMLLLSTPSPKCFCGRPLDPKSVYCTPELLQPFVSDTHLCKHCFIALHKKISRKPANKPNWKIQPSDVRKFFHHLKDSYLESIHFLDVAKQHKWDTRVRTEHATVLRELAA